MQRMTTLKCLVVFLVFNFTMEASSAIEAIKLKHKRFSMNHYDFDVPDWNTVRQPNPKRASNFDELEDRDKRFTMNFQDTVEPHNPDSWENTVPSQWTKIKGLTARIPLHQRSPPRNWLEEEPLKRSPEIKRERLSRQIYDSLGSVLRNALERNGILRICKDTTLAHVLTLRRHFSRKMNMEEVDPFSTQNINC